MERFQAEHLPHLTPTQIAALDRLLDAGDPELMDWILARSSPRDDAFEPLLALLRGLLQPRSSR